jgi:hypothetical protein
VRKAEAIHCEDALESVKTVYSKCTSQLHRANTHADPHVHFVMELMTIGNACLAKLCATSAYFVWLVSPVSSFCTSIVGGSVCRCKYNLDLFLD